MATFLSNNSIDETLNYIKNNGDRICLCSQYPSTFTQATNTYKLADIDITSSDYTGPLSGDVSGRKLTVNQQSDVTIDASGTATHLAIVDTVTSSVVVVTEQQNTSVTSGNTRTIESYDIEIRAPQIG